MGEEERGERFYKSCKTVGNLKAKDKVLVKQLYRDMSVTRSPSFCPRY